MSYFARAISTLTTCILACGADAGSNQFNSINFPSTETADKFVQVAGSNVSIISEIHFPEGRFVRISRNAWAELGNNGSRFNFVEVGRDRTTIYLRDNSRGVNLQLRLSQNDIFYSDDTGKSFPLYNITEIFSKPLRERDPRWASCKVQRNRVSLNLNQPTTVTFVNRSDGYRGVYWMNYQGQPVHYASLDPGETYTVSTSLGHPWMFTDGPGNCIEMFQPQLGVTKFEVAAPSPRFGNHND